MAHCQTVLGLVYITPFLSLSLSLCRSVCVCMCGCFVVLALKIENVLSGIIYFISHISHHQIKHDHFVYTNY